MSDLFHHDVVEMIERETRRYELWSIDDPDHPDFATAYRLLWGAFGPAGEMEREAAIRQFLLDDAYDPTETGTFIRYFLIIAKDRDGNIRGVRDGTVMVNPSYAPDLCVIYLSHIYMVPEARGTVLTYWLRIAPMEIATQYLKDLHALGKIVLPEPDAPGKYFGMRMDFAAEMEFFSPEDRISWQRILFYGRGGFDAIDPRHFPYVQPDFRAPELVRATGQQPLPFMVLLRRVGRERGALLPIAEARAIMRLLYDDFACHCDRATLEGSLQHVLDRLEERAKTKQYVKLLPLPTGAKNLRRLRRLFRYRMFGRYYADVAATRAYMTKTRDRLAADPAWLDREIATIAEELEKRPAYVYATRAQGFTWEGAPAPWTAAPPPRLRKPLPRRPPASPAPSHASSSKVSASESPPKSAAPPKSGAPKSAPPKTRAPPTPAKTD